MRFSGKQVLVTGAASGIGQASAILFAAEGANVTIGDINAAGLEQTAAAMARPAKIAVYDASDYASCRQLVSVAAEAGLDVLCNIAGIHDWGPSTDFDEARFERSLSVNLTSLFALSRAALPHLIERGGNIVNISSAAGMVGVAYNAAYCAAKAGVLGLTKSLAIEFAAKGVRVNAICPGMVNTPMIHAPRTQVHGEIDSSLTMRNAPKLASGGCEPEDIAEAIAWLASEQARKVSGAAIPVDCAQTAG
jgi:NAD(P)-dependent dehydrogenase (short-subunit alcohol dehydrogenase family)